jgi:hypothetical protein
VLFKPFDDDMKCHTCGKKYNDLVSGKESCQPCEEVGLERAQATPIHIHLWSAVELFFSFEFVSALGAILVASGLAINKVKSWIGK